jgi:quercetin dioxygenase-like cupin family protein
MVFDVSLDYFFAEKRRQPVFSIVRARERLRFPDRPDSPSPSFYFECLAYTAQNKGLQAYLAEFPFREPSGVAEHFHEGVEFLHVLEGALAIRIADEEHALEEGDSVYFDGSEPHGYRGLGEKGATALVITTPPRL